MAARERAGERERATESDRERQRSGFTFGTLVSGRGDDATLSRVAFSAARSAVIHQRSF